MDVVHKKGIVETYDNNNNNNNNSNNNDGDNNNDEADINERVSSNFSPSIMIEIE